MSRKAGTVIRVGAPGWRAARDLYRRVRADGWSVIGVDPEGAPKVTMGSVAAMVLQQQAAKTAPS